MALPMMRVITKGIFKFKKLQMCVIGILAYGHGDNAIANYNTSIWLRNSNYAISYLYKVLQVLDKPPICESKLLFFDLLANDFFEALL